MSVVNAALRKRDVKRDSSVAIQLGAGTSATDATIKDLLGGLYRWHLWTAFAWLDVKQRYRRAVLGPFWITISMCVLVFALGIIYAGIFRQDVTQFLPYLAAGFIIWYFLSGTINESATAFIQAEGLIRHGGIQLSVHVLRTVYRNIIIGAHNLTVMLLLYVWQPVLLNWKILLLIPGLALMIANIMWVSLLVGVLCTRFRDLPPIVTNVLQMLMFVSPIMYRPNTLPAHLTFVIQFNPIYYLIEAVRAPLLGQAPSASTLIVLVIFAVLGWAIAFWFFKITRSRVAYWI